MGYHQEPLQRKEAKIYISITSGEPTEIMQNFWYSTHF